MDHCSVKSGTASTTTDVPLCCSEATLGKLLIQHGTISATTLHKSEEDGEVTRGNNQTTGEAV